MRKSNVLKQVIEMIFSLTHMRAFDIDDIIANTNGGIIGFFFVMRLSKLMKCRSKKPA